MLKCSSAAVITLSLIFVAGGCSFNTAPKAPPAATGAHPLGEGETLGKIDHLPGGTAVTESVITLSSVSCVDGQVTVGTNLKTITGKMDCEQQVPLATLEHFYGQVVGISYAGGRLRIESTSAGTIDLPVKEAAVKDVDATP